MKLHEERLLNEREVAELIGVSKSTLRRMVSANEFPKPIRIGKRAIRWRKSEVLEWLASRPRATEQNLH